MNKLRDLLFWPGAGWLRWKIESGTRIVGYDPGESEVFMPPIRRLLAHIRWWSSVPWAMLIGYRDGKKRYRFSWEESRPCWEDWSYLIDPDFTRRGGRK